VLSGGTDGEAAIWELSSGTVLHRLGGLDLTVSAGAWARDGTEVAVAAHDGQLTLWNAETGQLVASQNLFDRPQSLAINPAGLLLVGDRSGAVTVYSRQIRPEDESVELQRMTKWQLHKDRVYGLAVSPVDSRIASASRDNTVAVTDLQLRHSVTQYFSERFEYWPLCRSVAGPDQYGRWYRTTLSGIATFAPGSHVPSKRFLTPRNVQDIVLGGQTLLAVSDGDLLQWKIEPDLGEPVESRILEDGSLYCVEFLNDEQVLLQNSTVEVWLWNLRTRRVDHVWPGQHWLAVSPDRSQFALAENAGKRLTLYDAKTLRPVWTTAGHTEAIKAIVFDPIGKSLISASEDRSIRRWDLATGHERMQFHNHEKPISLLAISPDGRTLASADLKFSIRLWDLRSGRPLYEIHRHAGQFQMLGFSDDGNELWAIDQTRVEHRWSGRPFGEEQ
jgi:WD40 repeat protein